MSPNEQRIAIAEACGMRYHKPTPEEIASGSYYQYEPDYLNDLNAMHEAEKVLTKNQWYDYVTALCGREWWTRWDFIQIRVLTSSTAAQRAEAFLKCLGLWRDDASNLRTVESTTAAP